MSLVYTVSDLNCLIKDCLQNVFIGNLKVEGEVSNKKTSNGHVYFSLKDKGSLISAIIWRSKVDYSISFDNGDKVVVSGKLDVYVKGGSYTMIVNKLEKLEETGDIHAHYEMLKKKCSELGYFDKSKKKKIPRIIRNIGIITAAKGAALQDILFVLEKNKVGANVYVKNCQVQGERCHKSVVESIEKMEKKDLDVLIIGRGGGSFEDLMGFSHESVVEAIYRCKIFTISAVGHEIDHMLSDFVADMRAPTPSVAGELVSDNVKKLANNIEELYLDVQDKVLDIIENLSEKVMICKDNLVDPLDKINEELDNYQKSMDEKIGNLIRERCRTISLLKEKLEILSPNKRGVRIQNGKGDKIDSIKGIKNGKYRLVFADGEIEVDIKIL